MRLSMITIFILSISVNVHTQSIYEFYNIDLDTVNVSDLQKADSILTFIIELSPQAKAYHLRGKIRKALHDSCGYCEDMMTSYLYYLDYDAFYNYKYDCLEWADSVFISKKFEVVDSTDKFRFFEVTFNEYCVDYEWGIIFDLKQGHLVLGTPPTYFNIVLFPKISVTNVFALYYQIDSTRIFTAFPRRREPFFKGKKEVWVQQQVRELIFDNPNQRNEFEDIGIPIFVIINGEGKLVDVKFPWEDIIEEEHYFKIAKQLKSLLENNYKYSKSKIFKKPVTYRYLHFF